MTVCYVTDGSFEGLLTAVYDAWRESGVLDVTHELPQQPDFLVLYKTVHTNEAKAEKVYAAIVEKISEQAARNVMLCWFSEQPGAGRMILDYLRLGFKVGPTMDEMVLHSAVKPLKDMCSRVGFEAHRLTGLTRFHLTRQGWYCAVIEPDYYVLPMLADHFAERMADSRWLIYDKGRELSAAFEGGAWALVPGRLADIAQMGGESDAFPAMWSRYFDAMAVETRTNLTLQRHFLPKRYWKHLVEKPGRAGAAAQMPIVPERSG